jgi:hypothetical protein
MRFDRRMVALTLGALVVILVWLTYTPPGLWGKSDAIGYAVCHQIPERTFQVRDRPISLCARCTGQFLGAFLAVLYLAFQGKRRVGWPSWPAAALMGTLVLFYAGDAVNSYLHFYPGLSRFYLYNPNNILRLGSGAGFGIVLGSMVWLLFQGVIWENVEKGFPLRGVKAWIGLFLLEGGMVLLVLSRNPLLLLPLALMSTLGILVLLTLLYTMIWAILLQRENSFRTIQSLSWLLGLGFMSAMLQIGLIDLLRYWLTGTWGGFQLG